MMKKYILTVSLVVCFVLSACYKDDSTMGNLASVSDITITQLPDVTLSSYTGEHLVVTPEIKTAYSEEELVYTWYLNAGNEENPNGYRINPIGNRKTLNYPINLPSGTYTIVLEVKAKSNDLTRTSTFHLNTQTASSQGLYVLKQTASGETALDLCSENVLADNILGQTIPGKPQSLSIAYLNDYVNPATNKTAQANMVFVTTDAGQIRGYRTEDIREVFNNHNLLYGDNLPNGEQPLSILRIPTNLVYLSSSGVRTIFTMADMSPSLEPTSGRYGMPVFSNVFNHCLLIRPSVSTIFVYWNDAEHTLKRFTVNSGNITTHQTVEIPSIQSFPNNLNCIYSGWNAVPVSKYSSAITLVYLCEQPNTADRYLLTVSGTNTGPLYKQTIKLSTDIHLAKAKLFATNRQQATYIYCVDENKVYAYSWTEQAEREVKLPGLPAGENITYISNAEFTLPSFMPGADKNYNKLIVGTQTGNRYKLYIYDMPTEDGGFPTHEPKVMEGDGILKQVKYLSSVRLSSILNLPASPFND